jgi:hypothetical protein
MSKNNHFFGLCLLVIAALAFLDGAGESNPLYGLVGASFGVIVPAACIFVAIHRERAGKVSTASNMGAIVVSVVGALAYGGYLFTGPSNPDTAGQMHVVLFPIIYVLIALCVFLPCLLIDRWKEKRSVSNLST